LRVLRMDCGERGLSKTNPVLLRKAVASASLPLMANVTAVRFAEEPCTSSKMRPHCSPSWRSTITVSNFRRFNRRTAPAASWHISGEIDNSRRAKLKCWIVAASADTKSANAIAMMSLLENRLVPHKTILSQFDRTPARREHPSYEGPLRQAKALRGFEEWRCVQNPILRP
jgi:hypothetical protein